MASIPLAGVLLDPTEEFAVGDKVRFTHKSTTGETIESAVTILTVPPNGAYSIELAYGLVMVEYNDIRTGQYKNLGVATVNQDNPATSIPELLNALVPVSSPELIEFQAILADCVTAETNAANSAADAEASAEASANANSAEALSLTYVYDMAQQTIRNTGVNTGDSMGTGFAVTTAASSKGGSTITSPNSYIVDQLVGYLGADGEYYSSKVKTAGATFTVYDPLEADIDIGAEVFSFYQNISHPSIRGYRCIADDMLRTKRFYEKTYDLLDLQYLAQAGSITIQELTTNSPDNCGSLESPATQILFGSLNSLATSTKVNYFGGDAVFRFTINTNGKDILIMIQDSDELGLFVHEETLNTSYPTLIEIPLYKKDASLMTINFKNTADVTADVNFRMTGLFSPIGKFTSEDSSTHVLHGDSWFEQEGISERLQVRMPNATIINNGVGGRTSANLAGTIYSEVEQYDPDYVHVMCGTNDALTGGGVSVSGFYKFMYQALARIKDIGASAIMYTPSQGGTDSLQWLDRGRSYLHRYQYYTSLDKGHSKVLSLSFSDVSVGATSEVFCLATSRTAQTVRVLDAYATGVNNINFGYSTGVSVPTIDAISKAGNTIINPFDVTKTSTSSEYFVVSVENTTGSPQSSNGFITIEITPTHIT